MPAASHKPGKRSANGSAPGSGAAEAHEVLTLSEAAAYLRASEADVLRLAEMSELPGRRIGGGWRFLKAGLQEWLLSPVRRSGKEALLALAGAWKDDPDIEKIVSNAHRLRGRRPADDKE